MRVLVKIMLITTFGLFIFSMAFADVETVDATHDTYVRFGSKIDNNYNKDSALLYSKMAHGDYENPENGLNYARRIIVQFDASAVTGNITDATLKLYLTEVGTQYNAHDDTGATVSIFAIDDNWDEATVTGLTAPQPDTTKFLIDSAHVLRADTASYVEFSSTALRAYITDQIRNDGIVSLAVYAVNNNHIKCSDHETGNAPQLEITTDCETFYATDDTYIRFGGSIGKNYDEDSGAGLYSKMAHGDYEDPLNGRNYSRRILLQFDISCLECPIDDVSLDLYLTEVGNQMSGSIDTGATVCVFAIDDNWDEETVTGATAPAVDTTAFLVDSMSILRKVEGEKPYNDYVSISSPALTGYIMDQAAGDGIVSLAVYAVNNNHIKAEDHEHDNPPMLNVTQATGTVAKATDDTYIRFGGNISKNYDGDSAPLYSKMAHGDYENVENGLSWSRRILLQFDISCLEYSAADDVSLDLYLTEVGNQMSGSIDTGATVNVFAIDDNWDETTVTGATAPAVDTTAFLIDSAMVLRKVEGEKPYNGYVSFSSPALTAYVQQQGAGDGVVSLAVYAVNNNHIKCSDHETGNAPLLTFAPSSAGGYDVRVDASLDDSEENLADGKIDESSSDLELSFDSDEIQAVGLRFHDLEILPGTPIANTTIQFTVDEIKATGTNPTTLTIKGEASDNAAAFSTTAYDISSRPLTTASVTWSPNPWAAENDAGADQKTPDLSSIVQEIIDRPGWARLNAIVFVITGEGTGNRIAESWDGESESAPLLHYETAVVSVDKNELAPSSYLLSQNYPNPFNPVTTITYSLPTTSEVTLKIYDASGRLVGTCVDAKQAAGPQQITWDAENYASGVYFYQLRAGKTLITRKMMLLK